MNILRLYIAVFLCSFSLQAFATPPSSSSTWQKNIFQVKVKKRPVRSFALWSLAERMGFPVTADLPYVYETGVGFLWAGRIVSTYHLIAGADFLAASQQDRLLDVSLLYANPHLDISVFDLLSPSENLGFASSKKDVLAGDVVYCITPSPNGDIQVLEGVVQQPRKAVVIGRRTSVPLLELSMSLQKGVSGSPVLDQQGFVVGMIIAAEVGVAGYALPITTVETGLQEKPLVVGESQIWLEKNRLQVVRLEGGAKEMGLQKGDTLQLSTDVDQVQGVVEITRFGKRFFVALPATKIHWE